MEPMPLGNDRATICLALCHWMIECKSAIYEIKEEAEEKNCYHYESNNLQFESIEGIIIFPHSFSSLI